jgi:hypothetical protein
MRIRPGHDFDQLPTAGDVLFRRARRGRLKREIAVASCASASTWAERSRFAVDGVAPSSMILDRRSRTRRDPR